MAVYIDKTRNSFGRMVMCHMLADSLDELHAMASKIGLKREWFQPKSTPHYDVSLTKRKQALDTIRPYLLTDGGNVSVEEITAGESCSLTTSNLG